MKIATMADIHFIRQKEQLGLGHAVYCARCFVGDEPFAVLLGDDIIDNPTKPALLQMVEQYRQYGKTMVGVQPVPPAEVSKYGIISGRQIDEALFELDDLIEKPAPEEAPTNLAIVGRNIIHPEIFPILAETKPGRGGENQLTDALKDKCAKQGMQSLILQGERHDIGDKWGYIIAILSFALRSDELHDKLTAFLREQIQEQIPVAP